jgi:hypothetical protein
MQMAIGEAHAFISGPHEVVHKDRDTCVELFREPINRKMWLYQVFDSYYWGKDLESVPTIVTVYDNTAGIYNPGRHIELGYYAYQCGGVRWEAYRSDLVYRNGPNSKPLFDDVSRTDRSDFYLLGGPNVTPELSPCVQPVPPHFPPYVPPSPPISDFYKRKVLS